MRVLYCASEVAPIIKVGGLGDVAGSLPRVLEKLGVEMGIMVPKYEEIGEIRGMRGIGEFEVEFDRKKEKVIVWQTKLPGSEVLVYLLENDKYLSRDGHQAFRGTEEEIERFAFFSKSIAEFIHLGGVPSTSLRATIRGGKPRFPDLLHLNDWHTSLIPLFLKCQNQKIPTLLTIHNLSYQGIAGLSLLVKIGLRPNECKVLKWDIKNRDIDILMEGIIHADYVNTVSPTYAKEIMTPEFGEGIEEILKGKEGRISGILNGIDYQVWNPEKDPLINFQFPIPQSGSSDLRSRLSNFQLGKTRSKLYLQKELGLAVDDNIPLLAFVGRLEPRQKGIDILYETMERLLPKDHFQFVMLATGDKEWEDKFKVQSASWRTNFKFIPRFDERLAHQIYAGSDIILVPSKFEPCGLPQMIAMRYGALPLVRKTGGLADSVKDGMNGFVFDKYSGKAFGEKINEALKLWGKRGKWEEMVGKAMKTDFSWDKSAGEYLELYKKIINSHFDERK